jgi:ABC-type sugar transport system ATPase subunit
MSGPGTVHALLGENGAGKSTLNEAFDRLYISRMRGNHRLQRKKAGIKEYPRSRWPSGISMIHQEHSPCRYDGGGEIFLGRELRRGPFIKRKEIVRKTREFSPTSTCDHIDPNQKMKELSRSAHAAVG